MDFNVEGGMYNGGEEDWSKVSSYAVRCGGLDFVSVHRPDDEYLRFNLELWEMLNDFSHSSIGMMLCL